MGCVLGTWNYEDIIAKKHMNKVNIELNLKLYLWTFEWVNHEHFFISPYYIGGRNIL
jgi:hypothetical protein